MNKDQYKIIRNLYVAALEILCDFDRFGEVLQTDEGGEYGPNTAIERLRQAISDSCSVMEAFRISNNP